VTGPLRLGPDDPPDRDGDHDPPRDEPPMNTGHQDDRRR
jgi:hypothetical protein